MDRTDEELIAAYMKGEKSAFNDLVERHLNGVYTYVLRFVGNQEEAEDIVQETFVKAWNNLKKYDARAAKFKTWLLRIARNTAIDFLRKKKHIPFSEFETQPNMVAEVVADESDSAEEIFARGEDSREIAAALSKLSEKHREILLLYYTNDITFEEIGSMLGESPNTMKSRHRRALRTLADAVKVSKPPGTN